MTEPDPLGPDAFAAPTLDPAAAERARRAGVRALRGPETRSAPETVLVAGFGLALLVWAFHAVLPA